MTVWKSVLGWEDLYEVNNLGQIRSKPRKYWKPDPKFKAGGCWQFRKSRLLKTPPNGDKYPCTQFSKNGKTIPVKVHRIVYETFNGSIPKGWHIDHKDGSRDNNKLDNLQALNPQDHKIETLERVHGIKMKREYLNYGRGAAMKMSEIYEQGFKDGYNQAIKESFKIK